MSEPWDVLEEHWPFDHLRADAGTLNAALGLEGKFKLEVGANPSFLVGRISNKSRFLGVGVNPRKNSDVAKWAQIVSSLNARDFSEYRLGAETYFVDGQRFNGQHYLPACRLLAGLAGLPEPADRRSAQCFADDYLIQAELVPFASFETKFSTQDVEAYQRDYASGRLATEVLRSLLAAVPWDAVMVRGLGTPWNTVTELLGAKEPSWLSGVGRIARVSVGGRIVPLVGLTNGRVGRENTERLAEIAGAGRR